MTLKVLVIEAQKGIRDLLSTHLHHDPVQVHHAADGTAALSVLDAIGPDLVIVSAMLAGAIDAFSLCREIAARAGDATRMLMIGTKGLPYEAEAACAAGAHAYIGHPFGPQEFTQVFGAVTHRARASAPAVAGSGTCACA